MDFPPSQLLGEPAAHVRMLAQFPGGYLIRTEGDKSMGSQKRMSTGPLFSTKARTCSNVPIRLD